MRKRGRYRPRQAMPLPPNWALGPSVHIELNVRDRVAVQAMLDGTATADQYQALGAACEAAIWTCDAAAIGPYDFDRSELLELRRRLVGCAQALLSIRDRHARVGRYGCTGPERAELAELADHLEVMRRQVPRRAWLEGYAMAVHGPGIAVPKPNPDEGATP